MSASLVGSEMCIRDRRNPWRLVGETPDSLLPECSTDSGGPSSHRNARQQPVSYTHLTLPTICSV
eukprot:13079378-Alexandrium_andersonii.AAC.1